MAIFSLNACCLQLEQTFISEAARMAQALKFHQSSNSNAACLATFWTVYFMEKVSSFSESQSSLLIDEDISCVVPAVSASMFGDYDWFTSAIRLARICSIAFTSLFSVSASMRSHAALSKAIARTRGFIDDWRMSVPLRFRPGKEAQHDTGLPPSTKSVLLQTHYAYYNLVFALERLSVHVHLEERTKREKSESELMSAARSVVELIVFIDFEAHVPIFISGIVPLSALFILFDFIIHNPQHKTTMENLMFLDMVTRYFRIVETASGTALPGSIISDFAGIAQHYVSGSQGNPVDSGCDSLGSSADPTPGVTSGNRTPDTFDSSNALSLDYSSLDTGTDNVQLDELRSVFGCVFPDWGGVPI